MQEEALVDLLWSYYAAPDLDSPLFIFFFSYVWQLEIKKYS
jgi:hypothetical protein